MPPSRGQKKGASRSDLPSAAKARKSSLAPMVTVFLSPSVSKALRRTKANSSKGSSGTASSTRFPRLIGDKAYDSDRLDRELAEHYGIEMIAPHRGERQTPTQDGRPLRRYRRRWRVERLFAWLHRFRLLVIKQGMALALKGILAGTTLSLGITRLISGMLFGITATDPLTFAGVAALLGAVAFLANYLPARRASKADPMMALRYE